MKRLLFLAGFLVLAAQLPLLGDESPSSYFQAIPEAVWATATGGGTWITSVQVTNMGVPPADIDVYFYYNGGAAGPFRLCSGLPIFYSMEYANILSMIDTLDPGPLDYFGKVGAVWFVTASVECRIHASAMTVNGNYGKSAPAWNPRWGNTAYLNRYMVIQHLIQNDVYRTFVGFHNASPTETFTVEFTIVNAVDSQVGAVFYKTLAPYDYLSFNPFAEAGVPTQSHTNCWLLIKPITGGYMSPGIMCFGSIANNYTNDTYALIAQMY